MQTVNNGNGAIFFLDAPERTGKIFLITLSLAEIRSQNDIASAPASSGIVAIVIPGGRTAYFASKLPLNVQFIEISTCNISKTSGMGKVLFGINVQWRTTNRSRLLIDHSKICVKRQNIWECIIIACRKFQANITSISSIHTSGRNKYFHEILCVFATHEDVKINYEYACPAGKRLISWDILTSLAGNWKGKVVGWSDLRTNFPAS